jgi:predicted GIY-YIG superfamily endonuclease
MSDQCPTIYIMANKRNGTLYTGVTSNLKQRRLSTQTRKDSWIYETISLQTISLLRIMRRYG